MQGKDTPLAGYVHPVKNGRQGRVDEGVDWATKPGTKIVAIGNAVVDFVGHYRGFGNYLAYHLTDGPMRGKEIYVAEHAHTLVKPGETLKAGQAVATASGTLEMGFAKPRGTYLPQANGVYHEGDVTQAGKDFESFVGNLGGGTPVASGPESPSPGNSTASTAASPVGAGAEQYIPPGSPPQPDESVPGLFAPGSTGTGGSQPRSVSDMWQLIASQPLSSPESQQYATRAQLASGG